jgi:hypothetical protein
MGVRSFPSIKLLIKLENNSPWFLHIMLNSADFEGIPLEAIENCEEIAALLGHKKCLYEFFIEAAKKLLPDV